VVLFLTEAQERMATPPARAIDFTIGKNRKSVDIAPGKRKLGNGKRLVCRPTRR